MRERQTNSFASAVEDAVSDKEMKPMSHLELLRSGDRVIENSGVLRFAKLSGFYFVTDDAGKIVYSGVNFKAAVVVAKKHGVL